MNWLMVIYGLICLIVGHIGGCLYKADEVKKLKKYASEVLALANAELKLLEQMKVHINDLEKKVNAK